MLAHRNTIRAFTALLALAFGASIPVPDASAGIPKLINRAGKPIHGKRIKWLRQSRMPLVGGRIRILSGACPGNPQFSACVFSRHPRTMYVRPGGRSPKGVLYHELGHTLDLVLLRHADRRAFKRTMGLGGRGWFTGAGPPAELFAEGYALCSRFGPRRPAASKLDFTRSVYGYRPTRREHRSVCALIQRAGAPKRHGKRPKPQRPADTPPLIEQQPPQPPSEQPATPPPSLLPIPLLPLP